MTDAEFAYQQLRNLLVRVVREYEGQQSGSPAAVAAQQQADTDTGGID